MNAVWPYCAATCVAWTQKYIDLKSYDKFTAYINFIVFFFLRQNNHFFSNTEQSYDQIVFSLVLTSKKNILVHIQKYKVGYWLWTNNR